MTNFIPRRLGAELNSLLNTFPCVFLNGPRQSGKSTLSLSLKWGQGQPDYVTFDDPTMIAVASQAPQSFLTSFSRPLVLDEIQLAPALFRPLKLAIDQERQKRLLEGKPSSGQFLLTGSANILALPMLSEALVGRMIVKTLYPFSAVEIHQTKGTFLEKLFTGNFEQTPYEKGDLLQTIQQSTYPEIFSLTDDLKNNWFKSYLATIIQRDIKHITEIEKASLLPQLLHLLAARAGGLINDSDLSRSVKENNVTTKRYRTLLSLLFLTFEVQPWFRNLNKRLVKSPKGYLIDTNMLCHLLQRNLQEIARQDYDLFGHIVENFVATELLKQISMRPNQPEMSLYHFRTSDGKEVDFIIEYPQNKIAGIEVKTKEVVTLKDCDGLLSLAELTADDFIIGVILYGGKRMVKLTDKIYALPFAALWH